MITAFCYNRNLDIKIKMFFQSQLKNKNIMNVCMSTDCTHESYRSHESLNKYTFTIDNPSS